VETISTIKKPEDLGTVNGNVVSELLWWSCQLGISPEKLLSVIKETGNSSEKIRAFISDAK
jgi:hypothetical protein